MKQGWEKEVQKELNQEMTSIDFSREAEDRILTQVYDQIGKRRNGMKLTRKHTGLILAAAMMLIGTMTAVGAGKIAFTRGGHSINDELHDAGQLKTQAEQALGESIRLPEKFSDGTTFSSGIVSDVEGMDENGNLVDSRPSVYAHYTQGNTSISLSIIKPFAYANPEKSSALLSETYEGIAITGTEEQYLFLPPDSEPSAEEKKLEEEGKLMISYGSSEVERKVFKSIFWDEGDLHYHIFTYDGVNLQDLAKLAKEVISSSKQ